MSSRLSIGTSQSASALLRSNRATPIASRRNLVVKAENWFDKLKGAAGGGAGGGSSGGGKEDAARRAIQDSFNAKKFGGAAKQPPPPPQTESGGGGGLGGMFGGGGGGGGGGGFGGPAEGGDEGGPEAPLWQEFMDLMKGVWVVFWNTVLFLGFAKMLHESLDWCCQIELLLLVGAPQQAFERVASVFYGHIESFEKHVLGWDIPQDEDMIPMYENLALYYPEEHAYTFDSYRYNMTEAEKKTLKYHHALRHYERDGGMREDVDPEEVQAIADKYEPMEADRRAYRAAKASGNLTKYWEDKKDLYKTMVKGTVKA